MHAEVFARHLTTRTRTRTAPRTYPPTNRISLTCSRAKSQSESRISCWSRYLWSRSHSPITTTSNLVTGRLPAFTHFVRQDSRSCTLSTFYPVSWGVFVVCLTLFIYEKMDQSVMRFVFVYRIREQRAVADLKRRYLISWDGRHYCSIVRLSILWALPQCSTAHERNWVFAFYPLHSVYFTCQAW